MNTETYPGLSVPASRILKYFNNLEYFVLLLDDDSLFFTDVEDTRRFIRWLKKNNIPDLRDTELGIFEL